MSKIKQIAMLTAKNLRKNMTFAEKVFWQKVRRKQFHNLKFLRQHPIFFVYFGKERFFIADFYCSRLRLIVEIDGGIHENQKHYDQLRDEILKIQKFHIVRFKNEEVLYQIHFVLKKLEETIKQIADSKT